jgi:hypothetical protein
MGIWDRVKKTFDSGGVKLRVQCPQTFRFTDAELPLAVELHNAAEEPRTVTALKVKIEGDESDREATDQPDVSYEQSESITLAAGETRIVELQVPLSAGAVAEMLTGDDVPDWMRQAGSLVGAARGASTKDSRYRVSVAPTVEGFQLQKWSSTLTRHLKPNEKEIGKGWTYQFGVDI